MIKWIIRAAIVGVLGIAGLAALDAYRGGLFDLPEMADDEYFVSYKNGFRGIIKVADAPKSRVPPAWARQYAKLYPERRFLSLVFDVPRWAETGWSRCEQVTPDELEAFMRFVETSWTEEQRLEMVGARFEFACGFEIEGEKIGRGIIYSVPRL